MVIVEKHWKMAKYSINSWKCEKVEMYIQYVRVWYMCTCVHTTASVHGNMKKLRCTYDSISSWKCEKVEAYVRKKDLKGP